MVGIIRARHMLDRYLVGALIGIVIQFGSVNKTYSQNLVPNGSFEEGINCPTSSENLTNECLFWYASLVYDDGILSTPEWFHECSELELMSPPEVGFGYEYPFDGSGFSGLVAYAINVENAREIVGVELIEPLIIGQSYLVTFSVSSFYFPAYSVETNRIGFNFATHQFYDSSGFPLNWAHYAHDEVILNSDGWQTISHTIVADSAYQFIHFGNFYDDDNTTVIAASEFPSTTYYGLDDVSVSHVLNISENSLSPAISVYPNPAHSSIQIKTQSELRDVTVSIYSISGNRVFEEHYRDWTPRDQIDVSDFEQGMYCLRIISPQGVFVESFIKN